MLIRLLSVTLIALAIPTNPQASDHIDQVGKLGSHGQVDISDLYAYFGERDCTNASDLAACLRDRPLTLVVNTYPGAVVGSHFSHHVAYEIVLLPGQIVDGEILQYSEARAVVIRCTFDDDVTPVVTTCAVVRDGETSMRVSAPASAVVEGDGMRLFSGLRADPFFYSLGHFLEVTGRPDTFPPPVAPYSAENPFGGNSFEGINVISIVLEIDWDVLGIEADLVGIAARSVYGHGTAPEQFDYFGRPEITNLTLHDHSGSAPLRLAYNTGVPDAEAYRARLRENIAAYDMIDGKQDWPPALLERFVDILAEDFTVLNRAEPCEGGGAYLSIERALLSGGAALGCGARALEEDIFRTMYTLFIAGVDGDEADFGMGVDGPYSSSEKALSAVFPYLAEPWEEQWPHWLEFYRGGKRRQTID
ncbi:DUF4331 family protein [Roseibium denhamense]|uniref:Uncharacterized protein n=1 Tax=Roseibium denhamense TaxID=76305 RepID=A0ABY1PP03_9HYPH|nr:DUF4331 family protein [Roseibium denhamense]SMP36674.1 protein of unknown function [Roseibium denhamense]